MPAEVDDSDFAKTIAGSQPLVSKWANAKPRSSIDESVKSSQNSPSKPEPKPEQKPEPKSESKPLSESKWAHIKPEKPAEPKPHSSNKFRVADQISSESESKWAKARADQIERNREARHRGGSVSRRENNGRNPRSASHNDDDSFKNHVRHSPTKRYNDPHFSRRDHGDHQSRQPQQDLNIGDGSRSFMRGQESSQEPSSTSPRKPRRRRRSSAKSHVPESHNTDAKKTPTARGTHSPSIYSDPPSSSDSQSQPLESKAVAELTAWENSYDPNASWADAEAEYIP